MAYVVARPHGRWEIRESFSTPNGPRARTLASFTTLSEEILERATRSGRTRIDRADLIRAARRAGVPFERNPVDSIAEELLRRISHGEAPRPGLTRLLRDRLADLNGAPEPIDESLADWIGASMDERGAAIVDLLRLVDRLPKPRKTPLEFPGLAPGRLRP